MTPPTVALRADRPARILSAPRATRLAKSTIRALWFAALAYFSGIIVINSIGYFTTLDEMPFLLEKAALGKAPFWRACLVVHVGGGLLCLFAALPQFSRLLLRRMPRLHQAIGWTYVGTVMALVVPPGLYLALHAKGGLGGKVGFIVTGVLLFHATWRGLERVLAKDFKGHVAWMLRSYGLAASAITFRLIYLGLFWAGFGTQYVAAIWLSLLVNILAVEAFLLWKRKGIPS